MDEILSEYQQTKQKVIVCEQDQNTGCITVQLLRVEVKR